VTILIKERKFYNIRNWLVFLSIFCVTETVT